MKHARPDYDRIQDPAGRIPFDEPVFLLRGQDAIAPQVVRRWSDLVENSGGDPDMVRLARAQADAMEHWQTVHARKLPDLPGESDHV